MKMPQHALNKWMAYLGTYLHVLMDILENISHFQFAMTAALALRPPAMASFFAHSFDDTIDFLVRFLEDYQKLLSSSL